MNSDLFILCTTAATIGFIHTALGPDHYLPFIVMTKARRWSLSKTTWVTLACGIGHVASSLLLGLVAIMLTVSVFKIEALETFRGSVAAWLLIGFGFAYFIWGVHRALRHKPHAHLLSVNSALSNISTSSLDGNPAHERKHHEYEAHNLDGVISSSPKSNHRSTSQQHSKRQELTPWFLFLLFVLGPCEPLIPLLMYPAATSSIAGVLVVSLVFALSTMFTMLTIVLISCWGLAHIRLERFERFERFTHAIAGATICLCGLSIQVLGL